MDLDNMTRRFLMGESKSPSVHSYLQSLREILTSIRPSTTTDARRLEMAQEQLREIRRHTRKLNEKLMRLEEQVKVLEEHKE